MAGDFSVGDLVWFSVGGKVIRRRITKLVYSNGKLCSYWLGKNHLWPISFAFKNRIEAICDGIAREAKHRQWVNEGNDSIRRLLLQARRMIRQRERCDRNIKALRKLLRKENQK